ncbi:uncharacterized protein SPSK_10757 [Sporothrix schenckii 1099-18]|uniref:non-specific serine/threonine protein kinase n=1 Tax=Sporothrix schenckii 1099-18 TaxID=1397361 RepID=A0A0F2MFZ0_SPOSC|nr:uncharacterized protein SPSK_10757 [Sporothrix schenckii 1099-18]KJR88618.1 hypothetical protein SPSK_10757 [Sporothrix schenckii 1099-18]
MDAPGWNIRPGAGAARDAAAAGAASAYTGPLTALQDLADALPGFTARLRSKEQLDALQRTLLQDGGSVEQIGMSTEQLQLRVSERVGEGTFCVVFRGTILSDARTKNNGRAVAIKFELRKNDSTQLRNEFRMYKKLDGCPGIPRIYTFGEMDLHKVLVMDLLGPSLETLFQDCGRRFSIKTVAMLAKQMITRIQTLHEHDLIYRDIKPENFLMGLPGTNAADSVHLIDYGMAKVYREPDTNMHIPSGESQSLSGTARYMSINAHCRRHQSRRDDLEALGHVFLYFARGNLPWQGVKAPQNDTRHDIMCEKKQATSIDDLCRGLPPQFSEYLAHTRGMEFEQDPNYDYLRGLFTRVLEDQHAANDNVFDWVKIKHREDELATAKKPEPSNTCSPAATPIVMPVETPSHVVKVAEEPQQKAAEPSEPLERPVTPQHPVPSSSTGAGGYRSMIVVPPPASPPVGKRRRSEFTSDLKLPQRSIRSKKTGYAFYDSESQHTLATLYRDVVARRYNFHRAIKQGRPGISSVASAAAAAAAALAVRHTTTPGIYSRPVAPLRAMGGASVLAPTFTEMLDTTLGKVISELEDISDKLLQDGDYSGAARVHEWLEDVSAATKEEIRRLHQEQEREQQRRQETDKAAESRSNTPLQGPASMAVPDTSTVPPQKQTLVPLAVFDPADPLEVDDGEDDDGDTAFDENTLLTQFLQRPGSSAFPRRMVTRRVPAVAPSSARLPTATSPAPDSSAARPYSRGSPAASVRSSMGHLSLGIDADIIAVGDNNADEGSGDKIDADDSGSNEILELVYRTASGTRKVVRVAGEGGPK